MSRARIIFIALLAAWFLFLAVQHGDAYDEAEHCHVAWLTTRGGETPMHDFFQNHMPLFWDLLKVYYLAGGDGPEVLYYGRALVVACALAFVLATARLARRWADPGVEGGPFVGLLGVVPLIIMSVLFPVVLVIRPETLSLPLALLSLLVWTRGGDGPQTEWKEFGRSLLAGALFGAAVFASPRFLLLGGAFVLLPRDRGRLFALDPAHLATVAAGAAAFAAGYMGLTGYGLRDAWFTCEFTSLLYKVGQGYTASNLWLCVFWGGLLLAAGWVGWRVPGLARRRLLLHLGYLVLVGAAATVSSWPFLYPHTLIVPATWLGVTFACAEGNIDRRRVPAYRWLAPAAAVGCLLFCLRGVHRNVDGKLTVVASVAQKHKILSLLSPGEVVLVSTAYNPITVRDATYYNTLLVDGRERMGKTVEQARQRRWPLPQCDYLRDVQERRPALVDGRLLDMLPPEESKALRRLLDREYIRPTHPLLAGRQLFVRRSLPSAARAADGRE